MDSAVDADLSRQMMQIICYLNYWEGLWEKNQYVFRLSGSLPLYLKASLNIF